MLAAQRKTQQRFSPRATTSCDAAKRDRARKSGASNAIEHEEIERGFPLALVIEFDAIEAGLYRPRWMRIYEAVKEIGGPDSRPVKASELAERLGWDSREISHKICLAKKHGVIKHAADASDSGWLPVPFEADPPTGAVRPRRQIGRAS